MDLLKQKRLPDDYASDVVGILRKMSFTNLLHLKVMGSGALKSQVFAGDYDAYEQVPIKSISSAVNKFQSIIQDLLDTPLTYIGDIKAGSVEEWRVVRDDEPYNSTKIKKKLKDLWDSKVISTEEYKSADAMLKPKITDHEFIEIKRDLRFHIVRWTPKEVLKGFKILHDGRTFTLGEAFQSPTITKLDVISWVQGNRFTDFSIIYEFVKDGKVLNPAMVDIEKSLKENIIALLHEKDYFKMAKRMFALARFKGQGRMVSLLSPMFNGDLGRLYIVYGDIGTLEYLVENQHSLPSKRIQFEIDQFKNRLGNVLLPKYLAEEPEIIDTIEKLKHPLLYTQNTAQLLRLLRQLRDRIKKFLSYYAFEYLNKNHLLPHF